MSSYRSAAVRGALVGAALALFSLAGCGGSGPKTYPVKGNVVLTGGDVSQLAGNIVELQQQNDHGVRASGAIGEDGSFTLGTYHEGRQLDGVIEGTYQARIILADEDDAETTRRPPAPVNPRYLEFETSGLSFQVPTEGDLTVTVSRR